MYALHLHNFYRQALRDKFSPTQFQRKLSAGVVGGKETLRHKAQWRHLASGCEGDVYSYNGSAIKVYDGERTPFRNCLAGTSGRARWPVEIPATLLLGNYDVSGTNRSEGLGDFVPVTDAFFSGSLGSLAKRLRASGRSYTVTELDNMYRPSLGRLLSALEHLHLTHGLCHDDIKPDNIFIAPEGIHSDAKSRGGVHSEHWLLGDLGNARHPAHPYHSSYLWGPHNAQLPDCRANDVLRLLKSYMTFCGALSPTPPPHLTLISWRATSLGVACTGGQRTHFGEVGKRLPRLPWCTTCLKARSVREPARLGIGDPDLYY
ncbi:unnamed protein product [Parascedosporium putredinis]|uniref:Protein kinase domain-containing protein n=1 Tax=Parascedosporium putredinis TaxID=1442378 RepID=A0A9P1M9Q6_9PEZI|nr:unnamed protein product [Parascedosporium putredinis]CAI7991262.1 unnamed protein product [Parascedosporium putredinis]